MKLVKGFLAFVSAMALVSCGGGGGDAGTPPFGGENPQAKPARLILNLASNSVSNGGDGTVEATATATDDKGQTLEGVAVSFEVDSDATFSQAQPATNAAGQVTALVSIGANRSNRIITVKAKAGGLTGEALFAVTGSRLTGTPLPAIVQPGSSGNRVEFRLVDANGNAMVGQNITVSGAGITAGSGKTGANGDYNFDYTAPAQAGSLEITATAAGVSETKQVLVQSSTSEVPPVTQVIRAASVDATPNVVAVNVGATSNRSEIRALFLGDNNAPIRNVRVRFDLDGDGNSIGGTFTAGTNLVYSDATGVASTAYVSGVRASPTNGLTVRACYSETDFPVGACPKSTRVQLTVTNEPIGITIGTNSQIEEGQYGLTYIKRYVVLAVDSSGKAMPNVEITPSIDLVRFKKGRYEWNELPEPDRWEKFFNGEWGKNAIVCVKEDANSNGVLEGAGPTGEDKDSDGQLEPRRSDVSIRMTDGNKTDSSGRAFLSIEYPKSVASWVDFRILVAGAVAGSEGRATYSDELPIAATDIISAVVSPPFRVSPYGEMPDCANPN